MYSYDDEDNAPMRDDALPPKRKKAKCHERCPYSRYCYYEGEDRNDFPDECSQYYKIDDLLMEARDIAAQERWEREHGMDEDIPFADEDYDGPEEEEF